MSKASTEEAKKLARLSTDCSFLLTHMIRQNSGRSDAEAKACLKAILDLGAAKPNSLLKGSPVGWYSRARSNIYNPVTNAFDGRDSVSSVCFTESTLSGLRAHRDVFKVKYGLAFDRELLFKNGANPCLNIREELLKKKINRKGERYHRFLYNFIPAELHPFINIIHESFDATHEREWRFVEDMKFKYQEIKFLFCPVDDFQIFAKVQKNGEPTLFDLQWLDRI